MSCREQGIHGNRVRIQAIKKQIITPALFGGAREMQYSPSSFLA
jgi:hypothetical protein